MTRPKIPPSHQARSPSVPRSTPSAVPSSALSTPSPTRQRQPLERMLDRRLQSVSTFISSTQSLEESMRTGFEQKPEDATMWSDEMPQAILFPANKPSSRADAMVLDAWISRSLSTYAQRYPMGDRSDEEHLSHVVEELVPILSIGLHEVIRQVTQHCLQRGVVLEKIWRTYVELFERALDETRASLKRHRERTARVEGELEKTRQELIDLQEKHPEQIERLSATLAGKFAQRQEELGEQLRSIHNENQALDDHLREQSRSVQSWFPLFEKYKENALLKQVLVRTPSTLASQQTPEARISADYRRILQAMPAESRRRVGFFVSSLLGLRGAQMTTDTVESLTERKDHNAWKISQLEERLQELTREQQNQTTADQKQTAVAPV